MRGQLVEQRAPLVLADEADRDLGITPQSSAVVSAIISRELKTPLVVLVVVLANAIIGFFQEHKAEAALDALRSMVIGEAKVRRDGEVRMIPMHEIVPGDIVLVEAGDRIPADGAGTLDEPA